MARKVLLENGYTFTPSSKTLVIPRIIPRERLVLITNVTTNQVIYNFSDANLKATSYTTSAVAGSNTTTIVLNYNTASMSSTDKIQFLIDEYDEAFRPAEVFQDPVNKLRVSTPQALIDTDFEYGTQITKWENLAMINNRPFAFASATPVQTISYISMPTNSRTVTVNLSSGAVPGIGSAVSIQDTYLNIANGTFIVESVGAGLTNFTYTARAVNSTLVTNIFDVNKTGIFSGTTYASATIGVGSAIVESAGGNAVRVTTTVPHGLSIGNEIAMTNLSGTTPPNGSFVVSGVTSSRTFTYYTYGPNPAGLGTAGGANIYVRPQASFLHRPFDGGVIFSSNANANYEQAIRQTRRYFRYQSGKGIQVSSGTILKPNLQIDSLTYSSGTGLVTVQTKEQHNIQPGSSITVFGANESSYNGTFTNYLITGYNTFTYTPTSVPSALIASGNYYATVNGWYGCSNRLGAFDFQNGLFFEFDGQNLYAVRRNSTYQISGKVSVTNGSATVTQSSASFPTYFNKQVNIGDFIVIRGQQYRIQDIASDTSLTITPSYRGTTSDFCIVSKTIDTKIPQSQWNLDKCDGTGPSGFNLDLTKMQMFYIDYSWYGAGFVRWGFRGATGDVIYCHKLPNNNVNTEAYMRSGNLPARYESVAIPPYTNIVSTVNPSDTSISVASTANFPPSGTLVIRNANTYEFVNYSNVSAGTSVFTGLIRGQAGATPSVTVAQGGSVATAVTTGLQVGQRVIHGTFPEATFIASIGVGNVTLTQGAGFALSGVAVTFAPMGATSGQTFTYSATSPTAVELAFPTYAPAISHWGTSAIMDGRFDDDKSLIFTYGQRTPTIIAGGQQIALFSIRVAPSVDNGQPAAFGSRELINRMQLKLTSLDLGLSPVGLVTSFSNVLVRAYLNATPSTATVWTNAVGNVAGLVNSSLAQIADYSGGGTLINGGEVTAGFFASSTQNIDLTQVRDLGNSILGGGGPNANNQIYPDGPDVLTITATNVGPTPVQVFSRISWTEAQA
jgi:hypothetical protein